MTVEKTKIIKERITLTIDPRILSKVDSKVDGLKIKNRSHAIELLLSESLAVSSEVAE